MLATNKIRLHALLLFFCSIFPLAGMHVDAAETDWSVTAGPEMTTARMGHFNAVLPDGRVVLFGGHGTDFTSLSNAEVWSPVSNNFSSVTMNYPHDMSAFAQLEDGRYLIAGGAADLGVAPGYTGAEIFNPVGNIFTPTGAMTRGRMNASAARLTNGKVLVAGGWYDSGSATYGELFNPATNTFSATGALNVPRTLPLVLPTDDGNAVVFGGYGIFGTPMFEDVELYNTASNSFSLLQTTLLNGESGWYISASNYARPQQMPDGKYLLLAYRSNGNVSEYTLLTFDPATKAFAKVAVSPGLPNTGTASLWPPLVDQAARKAYLLGYAVVNSAARLSLYVVDLNTMIVSTPVAGYTLSTDYYPGSLAAALLQDGRILLTGGHSQTGYYTNFSPVRKTLLASIIIKPAETLPPLIAVAPKSVNAGSVKLGVPSAPTAVTILNNGKGELVINAIGLSGPSADEFDWSGECGTVAAGSSCTVAVTLTAASVGNKNAILTIASNDPKKPQYPVKLKGKALPPKILAAPKSIKFAPARDAIPPYTATVEIKNTGVSDLVISSLTISGTNASEFDQTNNCTTIAQGGSCPVTVSLLPATTGKKSALLTISSNDPKKPALAVKLSATVATLNALTGGTFTSGNGLASVSILPGELPGHVKATAPSLQAAPQLPEGLDVTPAAGDVNVTLGGAAYTFTLSGEGGFQTSTEGAVTITLPFDASSIPPADLVDNLKVMVRIFNPEDGSVVDTNGVLTVTGTTARITIETRGLPQHFTASVIYNPNMETVDSGESAATFMSRMVATTWPAQRWCVIYNKADPQLVAAVKNRHPEIAGNPTPAQMQNDIRTLIKDAAVNAQAVYQKDGFIAPDLFTAKTATDVCGNVAGAIPRYVLYMTNAGSYFQGDDPAEAIRPDNNNYGRIYIQNKLVATGAPVLDADTIASGPVGAVVAHEMLHAVQSRYVQLGILLKGYYEGTATAYGETIANNEVITVRKRPQPNLEVQLLNHSLVTPGFPPNYVFDGYRNQDFFAYVGKQYNGGSLSYIADLFNQLKKDIGGVINPPDYRTYESMDIAFKEKFGKSLKEIYLDFLRQRALEHNANSQLGHAGDKVAGFADNLFGNQVVDISLNLSACQNSQGVGQWLNWPGITPFAARALRIKPVGNLASGDGLAVTLEIKPKAGSFLGTEWEGLTYRNNTIGSVQETNTFTAFGKNAGDEVVAIMANTDPLNTSSFELQVTCGPNIESLSPDSGREDTSVTISGSGFGDTRGSSTVTFNGVSAAASTWSATQITVKVPQGASSGDVVVNVNGVPSNGVEFTVLGSGTPFSFVQEWAKVHWPSGWDPAAATINFSANVNGQISGALRPIVAYKNYNVEDAKIVEITNMKRNEVVTVSGSINMALSVYSISPATPTSMSKYTYSNPVIKRYVYGVLKDTYPAQNFSWTVSEQQTYNPSDLYVEYTIDYEDYSQNSEGYLVLTRAGTSQSEEFHLRVDVTKDVPDWDTPK